MPLGGNRSGDSLLNDIRESECEKAQAFASAGWLVPPVSGKKETQRVSKEQGNTRCPTAAEPFNLS